MNYGFETRPNRAASLFGALASGLTGIAAAVFAFFAATAIFSMIADALPSLRGFPSLALYGVFLLVPAAGFANVLRSRTANIGPRIMCVTGIIALTVLGAGEMTGLLVVYPHHVHFFITPGPF